MVLDLDAKTMLPVNMHSYYIDVDETNKEGAPNWKELHDYKESYKMDDLRPANFKDLAVRIFTDKELATTFEHHKRRDNKNAKYEIDQLFIYCDLVTSEEHQNRECNKTGELSAYGIDNKMISKHVGGWMVDKIIKNWVDYSFDQ